MRPTRFLPAAELELLREITYYSKARAGTGARFKEAVHNAVMRAVRFPHSGAPSFGSTRVILVKGFPFNVVYRPTDADIVVVAIAPHRREPHYWKSRLE